MKNNNTTQKQGNVVCQLDYEPNMLIINWKALLEYLKGFLRKIDIDLWITS
jgi:hypothetical protein